MSDATVHAVYAAVDRGYAETEARLANDPEWMRLKAAAEAEALVTPDQWFHRNYLAIQREIETPWPKIKHTQPKKKSFWERLFG